jgi:uroporphyrinogen-III synthase
MHVLLTRPMEDSLTTAKLLNKKNIKTTIEPLFEIKELETGFSNVDFFRALIFTSKHAVKIFATRNPVRNIPAYCVGEQTAETAKEYNFTEIHSADGDENDLAELIISKVEKASALLRLTGYDHTDKFADKLRKAGFTVMTLQIYEAVEKDSLTDTAINQLRSQKLNGVLFFSPKTVSRFYTLVHKYDLSDTCRNLSAWCISDNVANAAKELPFREIRIAAKPTQEALLESIFKETSKMFTDEDLPPLPKFKVSKWLISGMMAWSLFFGAIGGLGIILLADFGPEKISPAKQFREKVVAVDNRVSALEQRTQKLGEQQQDAQQKIATQSDSTENTQMARILIGLTQLKTAYDNDTSLSDGITTLKTTIKNNAILQNLNDLEKQTADNFPSKEKILDDLQNLQTSSGQTLKNEQGEQPLDWQSRAKLALGQLVRVTPTKNIVKDKDIERVEQAVTSGDFNLARKYAAKLPQAANAQAIIAEINIRSQTETTVRKIISQIGSALGQNGGLY